MTRTKPVVGCEIADACLRAGQGGSESCSHETPPSSVRQTSPSARPALGDAASVAASAEPPLLAAAPSPVIRSTLPFGCATAHACQRACHGGLGSSIQLWPSSSLRQVSAKRPSAEQPPISSTVPLGSTTAEAWRRAGQGGGGSCCQLTPSSMLRQTSAGLSPPPCDLPPMLNTTPDGKDTTEAQARPAHPGGCNDLHFCSEDGIDNTAAIGHKWVAGPAAAADT
mmetsp:Transcript_85543/g.169765  ORF Transcript_85543/g.169765 Transcript_85543/m.169765 type:complete len:225 (+) Transcript_85543:1118-1792(+)